VGRVHTELCREFPHWNRKLEHLPGLNLTVGEITDPFFYYPEFPQWTFYKGDKAVLLQISSYLASRQWTPRDELFHLKKLGVYFGPYQRGIDPAVNIGPWESKYPLHSRYMHYFVPPVQSMLSLKLRRPVRGKMEALRFAAEQFPNPQVVQRIQQTVERHFEVAEDYAEPRLSEIEAELDAYLSAAYATLERKVTLIPWSPGETRDGLRQKLTAVPIDPVESFFEGTKFCRLMKGRLLFFAEQITWFDTDFLIRNELGRIVTNFYAKPLKAYGVATFGSEMPPEDVLARVEGNLLSRDVARGFRAFAQAAGAPIATESAKAQAREVARIFDPVLEALERLGEDLRRRAGARNA
jgi:hypothetical protein